MREDIKDEVYRYLQQYFILRACKEFTVIQISCWRKSSKLIKCFDVPYETGNIKMAQTNVAEAYSNGQDFVKSKAFSVLHISLYK